MNDLDKLEEIYNILGKALRDIENVGELSDYDLDNAVEDVFNTIDDAHAGLYGLIGESEWIWEKEKDISGNLKICIHHCKYYQS